jgi:membrane protease YdiL (CAAX protease family)
VLLGAWAEKMAGEPGHSSRELIVGGISFQGAALVLIGFFVREHGVDLDEAFGFRKARVRAVLLGLLVAFTFLPVGLFLQSACADLMTRLHIEPKQQQAVEVLRTAHGWSYRLCLGIVAILLAPAAEETLFRGILYPAIKQAGFPRIAFVGTALLFAAIHLNLVTFVPLFVLALILTFLYEKTDNLLAPIATHAIFNTVNFTMLYVQLKSMT